MAIETPEYKIISKREGCEVRRYSDIVIAKKIRPTTKSQHLLDSEELQVIFLVAMIKK